MWLPVGVQEQVRAERAAPVLRLEQAQGAAVERGLVPAAPLVPVGGQGGIAGGRPAGDLTMPDDGCPGQFGQVGAAGGVAGYPVAVPGGGGTGRSTVW